jgi:lysophospholipase L1-like esterase
VTEWDYSNVNARPPGRFVTVAGWVLPGVRRVQSDVVPFAGAWRRSNRDALAATGPLWVALGDSLTQGVGAPSYDRGWVGQLRSRLADAGRPHRVINLAVSGATTRDVQDRQLPELQTLQPDLVTLMIGSNDMMRPSTRREFADRFTAILHTLPPGSIVTTLPNPSRIAAAGNAALERIAADRGLVIAELRDPRLRSWRGRLAADHFHPNERGYSGLADIIADSVLAARRTP